VENLVIDSFMPQLIVVVVDIGSVSVGAVVPGSDGSVLIVLVLPTLVSGATLVHPVGEVGLQPLWSRKTTWM